MSKLIAYLIANDSTLLTQHPAMLDEFEILEPIFANYNMRLIKTPWRDPSIDWQSFTTIFPKACCDYALYPEEFKLFLQNIKRLNIPMINSVDLIEWNMRKTYFLDLKRHGLPVAEFVIIPQNSNKETLTSVIQQLHQEKYKKMIAKPSVSIGALNTEQFLLQDIDAHYSLFHHILSYADLILQPFFAEIILNGEYSYLFINKQFSHAVLKKPAQDDYRAHPIFNATITAYQPSADEIQQAISFIAQLNPACQYARVDVFKREQQLFLIELELIEPYFYLEYMPIQNLHALCRAFTAPSDA